MRVSWAVLDDSIFEMEPPAEHALLTKLSNGRPSDEPWLALDSPLSAGQPYRILALTLDAWHAFSDRAIAEFGVVAKDLVAALSRQEREEILRLQAENGNPPELWDASHQSLRAVVPQRMLSSTKAAFEGVLSTVEAPIVGAGVEG